MKPIIEVVGLKDLERKLKAMGGAAAEALETAVQAGALIVQNDAKKRAPYRTGTLRRSIHMETIEKARDRVVVSVGTNVIYAAIQEFGGIIKAKNAPFLVFRSKSGRLVRTKSVYIPPRPYLRPAKEENITKILHEIRDVLREAILGAVK